MSLTTDSDRSDHEPPPSGLRSPLYGTATFTSLSPSSSHTPLSDSGRSSTRLSYLSRSGTPNASDDGTHLRRVAISPTVTSYDSRRYSDSDSYTDDNDNSFNDAAEVEDVLSHIDEEISHVSREGGNWSSGSSSSGGSSSSKSASATGSYATATTEPLNFDRERRVLSIISERTETQSLSSGSSSNAGAGTGIFQNLFSSTFSRPTSLFSSAARSIYGGPASPLTPPPSISAAARPATPERTFKPAPPTGRRVGNLVASFESDVSTSRPGSVPLGPRSPSPYDTLSRSTSPTKSSHTRASTEGSYAQSAYVHSRSHTDGGISMSSSYLSPPMPMTSLSRSTFTASTETERPHSPLSSVRNIVAAWKERSPEKASSATSASRSTASQSAVSGPSYTSSSASSVGLGFGFGDGIFSLRRRATLTATSGDERSRGTAPTYTDDFGSATGSVTETRSLGRSGSVRSVGGSSIFDSELDSFIRGDQDPLRVGQLWYLNVHAPPPFRWQRCRAILYPNALLLTWIAPGGGRGVVTLDLVNCNEVRSVPSPSQLSARDDIGTVAALLQMGEQGRGPEDIDLVEMLCPFQLLYTDGVERLGAESARERVRWVSAVWEALDRSAGPPDRSMTRSPTGSIRTIRSVTSSIISTGSGSATTTYLPPLDTIPDLPDFDTMTFTQTQSLSPRNSLSGTSLSSYTRSRTRASDDGAISSRRGGLLNPLDARSIEITPSRSSSLRRTSSLADLDAEFASVLRGSGITLDSGVGSRSRTRGGSSRFSARWTREPSEYGGASSTISPSESASAAGVTRRVPASTFYTLSPSSAPTFTQDALDSSSSDATQIIPSSLSLRGTSSASLLGDSHSGPTTTEETIHVRSRSSPGPTTPTRSRSPETLYTSSSGLSRASAVRRRTPRTARTYSQSESSRTGPTMSSTYERENEYDEPSQWSSLQGSYTTTSYEYSDYLIRSRAPTESEDSTVRRPRSATISTDTIEERQVRERQPRKGESESDEEVFLTPTRARTATVYHSAHGTPTPSSSSLPMSEYETAIKAASTDSDYTTAHVCPSTPPMTETEYLTAQCWCKPAIPSIPDDSGSLTPTLSLTSLTEKVVVDTEVASLYTPSEVPTIPSVIEEADVPLPESEVEESPLKSVVELEKTPTVSLREPTTPSSVSTELQPSTAPTPTVIPPTPSSVTETSEQSTSSLTATTESSGPTPSSPSSPSIASVPITPSSPSSVDYKTESSKTPKSKSLYVPSHSSFKSSPSVTDYESSIFAASPSLHSIPMQDPVDVSFETSFMRPGASEILSELPSPFLPKGLGPIAFSSTATPTATTTNSTTSISQTPTATRTSIGPAQARAWSTPDPMTPSSVTSASTLTVSSEKTPTISSLTPSSAMLTVPPLPRNGRHTPTLSSLTASSYLQGSHTASSAPYTSASSLTASSPFDDESILGHMVTVSRTPSSVSDVSTTSMSSSVFAPSLYDDAIESPATVPTLLSSRSTTPRPTTPRGVPLPSSPSLSFATATQTESISTPRSDAQSLHTMTSVATSDVAEAQREEILTHDVNRLLRYLHDLDQIRGGETQDMKEHLQRIEDELRDLADFLHKPAVQMKDQSVSGPRGSIYEPTVARPESPVSDSLEYVSTVPTAMRTPKPASFGQRTPRASTIDRRTLTPASAGQIQATSGSTSPLPVPEPQPRDVPAPSGASAPSIVSLPQQVSPTYSPSTVSEGMSFLSSHHSDDFSLMSLEDYPAVPISMPGSPSSPSSWGSSASSSTAAPWPPSSVTPSSDPRSSLIAGEEYIPLDLTPESPYYAPTPMPIPASPLASLASAESALPAPPRSMTPSQEAAIHTPLPASPMPAGRYAGSPLPSSSPFGSSMARSLSLATPPPDSSMISSSSAPSIIRDGPTVPQIRQPTSPVLSLSTAVSEPDLVSPFSPGSVIATQTPSIESPALPVLEPIPGLEPSPVQMPVPELALEDVHMDMPEPGPILPPFDPVPTPPIVVSPHPRDGGVDPSRALDGLRDLLEDLRGQTQALWDGQRDTNHKLDDLVGRPAAPSMPVVQPSGNEEIANRLHNIEGLLDGILRDLSRGGMGSSAEPSEISSDTSSALRRYIDRLRERRQEPLQMPTPIRAPPPNLDSEWLDFLSEPPPIPEQPIQGPPSLVPLYRRAARRPREESMSPPLSIESPPRARSVPIDESIPYMFHPSNVQWQRWIQPRLQRPRPSAHRPESMYRTEPAQPLPEFGQWTEEGQAAPPARPVRPIRRPESQADIDMLAQIRRLRQQADPNSDGFVNVARPQGDGEEFSFEEVPPPRVHTAPPTDHVPGTWYRPQPPLPGQMMGDPGATVPTPGAPLPRPGTQQGAAMPPTGIPMPGMMMPLTGPPPPFNEMLDLLRQNRLAQTASIDQQREIMRYMRGLNQWLEHDVRDRQNEMRSIGARVDALRDALRGELNRLGVPGAGGPILFPPAMPGQPQGPQGQTFIVPPLPQPQPILSPGMTGGVPVIPGQMSMPHPQVPFTPGPSFAQQMPGGPPVIPPFQDEPGFIPPRPEIPGVPVVPDFDRFPRPAGSYRPQEGEYTGSRYEEPPPFIPPRPPQSQMSDMSPGMVPVPPPQAYPGQPQFTVLPPPRVERSDTDSRSSRSSSPRRHSPRIPDINIHVPSPPAQQVQPTVQPSQQAPPAVVRMDDQGRLPGGPLHPDLTGMYQPTVIPQQPTQPPQPVVVVPPPQTVPSGFPGEHSYQSPPPQPIYPPSRTHASDQPPFVVVQPSHRSRTRSRSRSHSPTRVVVHGPGTGEYDYPRRHRRSQSYRDDSHSPPRRLGRTESDRPTRRRHDDSRSLSSSPRRRLRRHRHGPEYDEGDRSRPHSPERPIVIHTDSRRDRSRTPPHQPPLVIHPPSQPSQFIRPPSRSRSSSPRSGGPIIIQQPTHPSMYGDPHAQPLPVQVIQPPQPIPPPSQVPFAGPPPTHTVFMPDEGRTRYSPSPPRTYAPAPTTQPPVIIQQPTGFEGDHGRGGTPPTVVHLASRPRSHSYSPRDGGRRRRRRSYSRSPSRSPSGGHRRRRRDRSRSYSRSRSPRRDEGRRRRRTSRSPRSDESRYREDYRSRRRRRSRSRSPEYDEDGHTLRRRHGTPYSEGAGALPIRRTSRSPIIEGDRHGRRLRRSSPYIEEDRPAERPLRHDFSPSGTHRPITAVGYSPSGHEYTTTPTIRRSDRSHSPSEPSRLVRIPTHTTHLTEGRTRPEFTEGDAGTHVTHPGRIRTEEMSPTRVVVSTRRRSPTPETIRLGPQRTAPTYPPESVLEPETEVIHVPTAPSHRPPPSVAERLPTVVRMDTHAGRLSPERSRFEDGYHEEPVSIHPSYQPTTDGAHPIRPPSPRSALHAAIHEARTETEPIIPVMPPTGRPSHTASHIPPEPYYDDGRIPAVVRTHQTGRTHEMYDPQTPSGPGDLALHDALQAHQERLEEQERRLEELGRAAVDAEERREQYFREHEEERQRLFQENEERRIREADALRDDVEQTLHEIPRPPMGPPMEESIISEEGLPVGPPAQDETVTIPAETVSIHDSVSIPESVRPVPPPMQTVVADTMPQLQEILSLLRAQQADTVQCKEAEAERFDILREEITEARAEAKAECEERIRMLEDELARAREDLELERGQRRADEEERIERERADVIERDEAVRAQLGDITSIVQEQREDFMRKRELMDERWQEKQLRREEKAARNDAIHDMLDRILQERELERQEREAERAAAAQRPSIEHVLEELRRQNESQIQLINNLTDAWRADSARMHQETIDAVRASAQEMVPYNLTGYLDEFSKALAGEIRTLLGEVGKLHEQKRTLQFEIGSLLHMHSQYGPGGQFEPDWHPTMGPLAGPPPPGPVDMGPPPPGPDEPPPPARPAWRTVQQRAPRPKRSRKGEAQMPPSATMAPPEPPIHHPPSWATWQPNMAFVPTPPPPGASPLVVPPPSGPTGLFGPRSPRGTMYGG